MESAGRRAPGAHKFVSSSALWILHAVPPEFAWTDEHGQEHDCKIVLKTWQKIVYTIVTVVELLVFVCTCSIPRCTYLLLIY